MSISKDFGKDYGNDFEKDFGNDFFGKDFGKKDVEKDVGKDFGKKDVEKDVGKYVGKDYLRHKKLVKWRQYYYFDERKAKFATDRILEQADQRLLLRSSKKRFHIFFKHELKVQF